MKIGLGGVVIALAMATAGCDDGYEPAANLSYEIARPSTTRLNVAVAGTLDWDGTCLYLKTANPKSKRHVVVFQRGAATVQDGKVLYGGQTYNDGDAIHWGGDFRTDTPVTSWAKVAPGCTDYEAAIHVYIAP